MAAKKRKTNLKKKKKNLKKKKGLTLGTVILIFGFLICMLLFLPVTFLLAAGMLPTLVAAAVDNEPGKNKTFTIGALNFAGCFPYLLGLLKYPNAMDAAVDYLLDPKTIIVMYSAAAIGYLLNWGATALVSSILVQRSKTRLKRIQEEKQLLKDRWGEKVNGKYELDEHGFPAVSETGSDGKGTKKSLA